MPGQLHLLITQNTWGDADSLRCEGIIVVSVVMFCWILQLTLHKESSCLIFSLGQPIDLLPLLQAEQDQSRFWHRVNHPLPRELIPVDVADVDCGFDGVEQCAHVFVFCFGVSATDHVDTTFHRIREHWLHIGVGEMFKLDMRRLDPGVPTEFGALTYSAWSCS